MDSTLETTELKNIKISFQNGEYIATLIDDKGFEVIRGFGINPTEAINDLHKNLI